MRTHVLDRMWDPGRSALRIVSLATGTLTAIGAVVAAWLGHGLAATLLMVVALGIGAAWYGMSRRSALRMHAALETLTRTVRETARGDFARAVNRNDFDAGPLRDLADAINEAAERARTDIEEMARLGRVRSEFLGNVSHELRTPIFAVQGYLETLLDGAADDPTVRDGFLRTSLSNVMRLHNLLADLIEISRIESGEMKLSFRYFEAVEFFSSVVEELRPTAEMAGVTLGFTVADGRESGRALGDRNRLKQVMVNLIDNAIKYSGDGGSVTVELEFTPGELEVRVVDTGIGIAAEHLPRIFERFYRVDRARSREVGGSGLGLAIAKHIVEAHRGTIRVDSEIGSGSTFAFRLRR